MSSLPSQIALFLPPVLVVVWVVSFDAMGGFGTGDSTLFNFHPLFMTIAFFTFTGQAVLAHTNWGLNRRSARVLHMALHASSVLFGSLGFATVTAYHARNNLPGFYSLHSWLGLFAFVSFCAMLLLSFVVFGYPRVSYAVRKELVGWHALLGITLFVLFGVVMLTGLQTKQTQLIEQGAVGYYDGEALFANGMGVAIILCLFVVLARLYQLKLSSPEDTLFVNDGQDLLT